MTESNGLVAPIQDKTLPAMWMTSADVDTVPPARRHDPGHEAPTKN
jgi:hypothetical protein